ncbi:hypothetical protein [Aestuariivivens sediminis]|uniref:hypothetical protein n=1 Tax=Aestuariivivens sediminis TaxID=2913557 RepID=UPI001F570702|nr:hypothetical protein [Aestuariivivens sediminis]
MKYTGNTITERVRENLSKSLWNKPKVEPKQNDYMIKKIESIVEKALVNFSDTPKKIHFVGISHEKI